MALRMVSLKSTFQRMTRLVRDVSVKAGKQIVCETEGEDVELDRNVVEEITDPLVHMIRNACDHGLETGPERVAAGKPEVGRVTLRAYHSGGSIVSAFNSASEAMRALCEGHLDCPLPPRRRAPHPERRRDPSGRLRG